MNQLSWLLYLASVCGNLNAFIIAFLALIVVTTITWGIVGIVMSDNASGPESWEVWRRTGCGILSVLVVMSIIGVIVPDKNTVYAIAASQMGEQALKTPLASKAEKALETWLDKQTAKTGDK